MTAKAGGGEKALVAVSDCGSSQKKKNKMYFFPFTYFNSNYLLQCLCFSRVCEDLLREIFPSVPYAQLPSVDLVNWRWWRLMEKPLAERNRRWVPPLKLVPVGKPLKYKILMLRGAMEPLELEFPEVGPPLNILGFRELKINGKIGQPTLNFLEVCSFSLFCLNS
jgi:hypothetical protein